MRGCLNVIVGAFIALVGLFAIVTIFFSSDSDPTRNAKLYAQVFAEMAVREHLKVPSKADFSNFPAVQQKGDAWSILGKVTGMNTFGGYRTDEYLVVMRMTCLESKASRCWDTEYLRLGGRLLVNELRTKSSSQGGASNPEDDLKGYKMYITKSVVNVRSAPGTNFKIVSKARQGAEVSVIKDRGRWVRVKLSRPSGVVGWVREDMLSASRAK